MKICPNPNCSVFGHIVYALTTRCPVCRWDLKNSLPARDPRLLLAVPQLERPHTVDDIPERKFVVSEPLPKIAFKPTRHLAD